MFNFDTNWGNLLAIYDTILQKWVALDIIPMFAIKQFAIIELSGESKLYAVNDTDLYQLYGSTETEIAQLYTRAYIAMVPTDKAFSEYGQPGIAYAQKSEYLKVHFQGGNKAAN